MLVHMQSVPHVALLIYQVFHMRCGQFDIATTEPSSQCGQYPFQQISEDCAMQFFSSFEHVNGVLYVYICHMWIYVIYVYMSYVPYVGIYTMSYVGIYTYVMCVNVVSYMYDYMHPQHTLMIIAVYSVVLPH